MRSDLKKGFTLIELLLVITIMGILVLLAFSSITKTLKQLRKNAFEIEVRNIIRAAKEGYSITISDSKAEETTYTYENGEESHIGNINIQLSGKTPENGIVKMNTFGKVALALYDGEFCAVKKYNVNEITIKEITLEECINLLEMTSEICFTFNSSTNTITNYDSNNPECPSDVVIPNKINSIAVNKIGTSAFQEKNLTSVIIPDSVTIIYANAFDSNFISSIDLGRGVTTIGDFAFSNNQITEVIIPNSVIEIGALAFENNLISNLSLGNGVTWIANKAFYNNLLTSVTVPGSITTLRGGIFENNQLETVVIESGVETIGIQYNGNVFKNNHITSLTLPNTVKSIGPGAFEDNLLTSVTIPNSVEEIASYAFEGNNLTNVVIPNSVTILGAAAFYNNQLTSVTLSNSIQIIDSNTFANNQLTSITIPDNIVSIGTMAFYNNQLTSITIPNSVTNLDVAAFRYNYILQGDAIIDNSSANITIGDAVFWNNGSNGQTTITPVYLR